MKKDNYKIGPITKKFFMQTCFSILTILLYFNFVFALGSENLKKIIQEEMIYPRECRYLLPVRILTKNLRDGKNGQYLKLFKILEEMKLVKLASGKYAVTLIPLDNTYDVIQQNMNISYELQSINLVLGIWDIEIDNVQTLQDKTIVTGSRIIEKQTPLYFPIINAISKEEQNAYSNRKVQWGISEEKGRFKVTEIPTK